MSRVRLPALILWSALTMEGTALACQVPVFRYALERWEADAYVAAVFPGSAGGFSPEEQAAIDFLRAFQAGGEDGSGAPANLDLKIGEQDLPAEAAAGNAAGQAPVARMAVFYPPRVRAEGSHGKRIWEGPLTLENARRLVDSPARREIVKRLLSGQSAVWLLLESGNAEVDAAAGELAGKAMATGKEKLKIPEGVMTREEAENIANSAVVRPDDVLQSAVPLKIDFSLLRLSRGDPAEALFLPMLLNIEDDLGEFEKEPMVFPVFGRGRLLEPIIGKGVNVDNILEYAAYVCGACSCEVKEQNPGQDLLIAADWRSALEGGAVVIDKILPPLEGTGILSQAAGGDSDPGGAPPAGREKAAGPETAPEQGLNRTPWILVGSALLLVLAAGTLLILLKNPS